MELPMDGSWLEEVVCALLHHIYSQCPVLRAHHACAQDAHWRAAQHSTVDWRAVTFVYCALAFCFVSPPTAFISAGVTVQGLFGALLGNPVRACRCHAEPA